MPGGAPGMETSVMLCTISHCPGLIVSAAIAVPESPAATPMLIATRIRIRSSSKKAGTLALEQMRANLHIAAMAIQIRTSLDDEPLSGQSFIPHRPERPEKAEGGRPFVLASDYEPAGDQPRAIAELVEQARAGERDQ